MTEYFVQPGTRVPLGGESTSPPDTSVPRGNPELGDGGVVQVIDAEWKRRAGVARNLAAELAKAQSDLSALAIENHYGTVSEGSNFSRRVRTFVDQLSFEIGNMKTRCESLSAQCENAHQELANTDEENASDFVV
ncbi:hypothetical protein [Gordonia polyisoprenivorans]|uniref:hypothetical protein n=1 Tax=Gordonia polyisoprenivorans TaxID=84595 RepID=UPI00197AFB72|nr:hypothetical protein [Gordonia polyisoprenivorans]